MSIWAPADVNVFSLGVDCTGDLTSWVREREGGRREVDRRRGERRREREKWKEGGGREKGKEGGGGEEGGWGGLKVPWLVRCPIHM